MTAISPALTLTARIELRGRHATGVHSHAIVDADRFAELDQYAWKAKPNGKGNNVYAVRNVVVDGKNITVRMHRVVLGYDGPLEIDHINHNALDNRRANLRVVTRRENALNMRSKDVACTCRQCGVQWAERIRAASPVPAYCSDECVRAKVKQQRDARRPMLDAERVVSWHRQCAWCAAEFDATAGHQRYCSESCRKSAKWRRDLSANKPKVERSRAYSRERYRLIKAGLWKSKGTPVAFQGKGNANRGLALGIGA